jgi:glycosyltransferase involved in cell wall biosynthesis
VVFSKVMTARGQGAEKPSAFRGRPSEVVNPRKAMPRVSTIIPCYNRAKYICQAIDSALAQKDVDQEVIVVDDGSTDNTWELLERYGGRIRKFRQANAGPYRARNHGAEVATGEWLAFLDSDDEWLPEKLAKQLAVADESKHLIYTNRYNFGELRGAKELYSDNVKLWEGDIFEPLLLGNFITTSSVLMRKSWFERLGGFDDDPQMIVIKDWDLWLRYAAEGLVGLCWEPLTRWRLHPEAITNNPERGATGRLIVIQRAFALPRGQRLSGRAKRQILSSVWQCSACHAAPTHPGKAIWWYLRSAAYSPLQLAPYKGIVKCCLRRD